MAANSEKDCTTYWATFMDLDGAVTLTVMLFATDDCEAKHKVKAMVDGHTVDLWDGVRLIKHFPRA